MTVGRLRYILRHRMGACRTRPLDDIDAGSPAGDAWAATWAVGGMVWIIRNVGLISRSRALDLVRGVGCIGDCSCCWIEPTAAAVELADRIRREFPWPIVEAAIERHYEEVLMGGDP